jgi:uncharacterized membrane protein
MPDEADQKQLELLRKGVLFLTERNRELEARVARLEARLDPAPAPAPPQPEPIFAPPPPAEPVFVAPPITPPMLPPAIPPPLQPQQLESKLGLNWLNRVAVITLIFGAIFAFKYAVDNEWLGPGARVAIGVVAALASLVCGDILWKRGHKVFAQGLTGLGLSLLYLSFWASFGLYHLLPQAAAFLLMVVTTAASAVFALRYDSQAIAVLGLLGAYITPVSLSTGEDHPWILFSYTFLVNLGGLAAARYRRWKIAEWVAFAATVILYLGWAAAWLKIDNRPVATVFLIAFYAQFASAQTRAVWWVAQLLGAAGAVIWEEYQPGLIIGFVIALGGLAVADLRQWREAPPWTLLCYWLGYGLVSNYTKTSMIAPDVLIPVKPVEEIVALLSLGFVLFFSWSPWWTLIRKRALRQSDLTVLVANAALYFGASFTLLEHTPYRPYMGLFAVILGAAHLGLARALWRPELDDEKSSWPALLAVGVTLAFLTLAMPIQFTGFRITIAWALEGAALAWLASRFQSLRLAIAAGVVLLLAFSRLYSADAWLFSNGKDFAAIANLRFLTFAVTAASFFLAAKFFKQRAAAGAAYITGHFVFLSVLVLEVIGWAERTTTTGDLLSVETTAVSVLLALYAIMLIAIGVATRTAFNRVLGLGLIGLVIVKLYLSDVWILGKVFRITAFLGLGVLLLVTSFLYSRFRHVVERLLKDDPAA